MENSKLSDVKGKELVAAGHAFAKAIGMDTPLIEIAKMVSELASRLDCALVRGDELQMQRDALAAENVALRKAHPQPFGPIMMQALDAYQAKEDEIPEQGMMDAFFILRDSIRISQEQTDAYLNSVRAEGVKMFANEMGSPYGDSEGRDYETGFNRAIEVSKSKAAQFVTQLRAGKDGE